MPSGPWSLGRLARKRTDGSSYWSYCVKWHDSDGTRRRVSLGTTERAAAEKLARDFWAKLTLAAVETVGEVVEAYLADIAQTVIDRSRIGADDIRAAVSILSDDEKVRLGPLLKTVFGLLAERERLNDAAAYKDVFRKLTSWKAASPYWAGLLMSQIDEQTSLSYQGWRKRAANTLRNELGLIRVALNWAADKGLIPKPAPKIVLPAMPESPVAHLTKAEFRRFLEGCSSPHVKLFAQLAVTTGGRSTALLELRWDRVDFDRRLIHLNPTGRVQKANKQRATVPLNDRLMPLLQEARAGALSDYVIEHGGRRLLSIKKGIAAAARRSKLHVTPHMFRHSAAVWMAEDRVPMEEIARYLGHTDTRITSRVYARFSPDYLRRAAKSLDW